MITSSICRYLDSNFLHYNYKSNQEICKIDWLSCCLLRDILSIEIHWEVGKITIELSNYVLCSRGLPGPKYNVEKVIGDLRISGILTEVVYKSRPDLIG